jgi:hypothetical protein
LTIKITGILALRIKGRPQGEEPLRTFEQGYKPAAQAREFDVEPVARSLLPVLALRASVSRQSPEIRQKQRLYGCG